MQVIEQAQDAVALIELEVVEVVGFRRGEEREVVSRVGVDGIGDGHCCPDPGRQDVTAANPRAQEDGKHVGDDVFHWMGVQSRQPHG